MRSVGVFIIACALSLCCQARDNKQLKVYILAGQSNRTGMVTTNTLEHIKMFPGTSEEFKDLFNRDGSPVVLDDVYQGRSLQETA